MPSCWGPEAKLCLGPPRSPSPAPDVALEATWGCQPFRICLEPQGITANLQVTTEQHNPEDFSRVPGNFQLIQHLPTLKKKCSGMASDRTDPPQIPRLRPVTREGHSGQWPPESAVFQMSNFCQKCQKKWGWGSSSEGQGGWCGVEAERSPEAPVQSTWRTDLDENSYQESWERFLPVYGKRNIEISVQILEKKPYILKCITLPPFHIENQNVIRGFKLSCGKYGRKISIF